MNHSTNIIYPASILGDKYLSIHKSHYYHSDLLPNNTIQIIECDTQDNSMIVKTRMKSNPFWTETDLNELCKHDIIDLSENGERWEGTSLKGQPFGYGCIYNENNQLIYTGFMFEGMKVCCGKNFYGDYGFEEYVGCFYKNMRHGYGKLSDKKKEVIYEGEWVYNQPLELSTICINEMIKEDSIHYKTRELLIEDECRCDLTRVILNGFHHLERLRIGMRNFMKADLFIIEECNKLKEIDIGSNCFSYEDHTNNTNNTLFQVKNCKELIELKIGNNSFNSIIDLVELIRKIRELLLLTDLPKLTTLSIDHHSFYNTKKLVLSSILFIALTELIFLFYKN